ncbi:ROK family transcriptional regulator [Dactylosporangium matsuzakiense]|uniref:Xylose repressor n=1 Tax=Dactylosporangium matsuzakiense TaxID=53360 RepID=A0A9W6NME2_9ACTN|nr:ROK family transcriptional regulator [Dactylosporangium matsuzakiense]UWZ41617.1 ROK family transcriptional regulator [Dactylosporangium matsuzakiense]GLL02309.1 xylose repressor [Dactylosporangium matsuzakiense]
MAGALDLLRHAHANPGVTRAEAAAALGLSSGSATEIMGRLRAARLLGEVAAPSTGRGRPTTVLVAHPQGPLVAVAELTHATWRVTTAAIGGELAPAAVHRHSGGPPRAVLARIRAALDALCAQHGDRVVAVGVSVPGTVRGTTVVQAATLEWRDVDLAVLAPGRPLTVGNDASLAGVAEALRGAARGHPVALHLTVEVGVGGVLLVGGVPALGATGAGGEFGHVPFGDPDLHCPCGARGCWDVTVDGRAMARSLGRPAPADPRAFAGEVLAAARSGDRAARAAVAQAASALGRGVGALLNALDPSVVTLGGLGPDLLASEHFPASVLQAAMVWRRTALPPIVPAELGARGPSIGAAESALAAVLPTLATRR